MSSSARQPELHSQQLEVRDAGSDLPPPQPRPLLYSPQPSSPTTLYVFSQTTRPPPPPYSPQPRPWQFPEAWDAASTCALSIHNFPTPQQPLNNRAASSLALVPGRTPLPVPPPHAHNPLDIFPIVIYVVLCDHIGDEGRRRVEPLVMNENGLRLADLYPAYNIISIHGRYKYTPREVTWAYLVREGLALGTGVEECISLLLYKNSETLGRRWQRIGRFFIFAFLALLCALYSIHLAPIKPYAPVTLCVLALTCIRVATNSVVWRFGEVVFGPPFIVPPHISRLPSLFGV